ncbi:MAG: chloride channel protein [Bacteroidales bacterium]|nr:chloride channel protein [Bacteroidales bacterium]
MSKRRSIFNKIYLWSIVKRNDRQFLLFCSLVIGVIAGFLALGLKTAVYYLRDFVLLESFTEIRLLLFILPAVGIFITYIMKKWILRDNSKHNVQEILYSISRRNSKMERHKIISSVLGAVFTAGFGGSVGLESPVISSGGAFGSNLARWLRMDYKEITLLLACGSAAGISAIFNTPIAGVVFAIEVLMIDLTRFSLIPLLLASTTGTIVTFMLYGEGILFQYAITQSFMAGNIPYYLLLAVVVAFVSLYFTKTFLYVQKVFEKIKNELVKIVIGGLLFGLLLYVFPQLYGEGYLSVTHLLNGDLESFTGNAFMFNEIGSSALLFVILMLSLILLKVVATSMTIAAGGVGGIFAPSAVTGAMTGYLFAFSVNIIAGEYILSPGNFALVGMAACLSGVLHAPLTGLFLIAEITSGYELIVPLMMAVTVVFIIVKLIEPHSIFTFQLAKRGELITHHKDKAVLNFLKIENVLENNLQKVPVTANLGELVNYISKSKRNIFPVIDDDGKLQGIVYIEDIRDIMFRQELYQNTWVKNLMRVPNVVVDVNDTMQEVMNKFNITDSWNLPVIQDDKYIGIISKSSLFSVYRKKLISISED